MSLVAIRRLTFLFLRVGSLTFGGGDPTMAALQSELVVTRRWLTAEQYALIYALARITPGTNLLAFSAATAWQIRGWLASMASVLAMTLPAATIAVLLTVGYQAWSTNVWAMAAIGGVLAAAIGMMATSAWQLLRPNIRRRRIFRGAVIFLASLLASLRFSMVPVEVLGLAALAGLLWRVPPES